jgi:4-amino-4-deoxy-L-arabinose transferase-like glycosyltransferase
VRLIGVIFALALGVRLFAQLVLGAYVHPETWEYETIADRILAGQGYSYPSGGIVYLASVSSPLYVLLTAGVYAISGHSHVVMLLLQAFMGATTAALAAWLAGWAWSAQAAWLVGVLVALDPGLVVYAAKLHSLSLDELAMLGVVATTVATSHQPSWRHAARLGVVVGLAALTRTTVLVLLPFMLAWLWRYRGLRIVSPAAAVLIVAAIVVYAPWPVRNSIVLGQIVPGSSEASEWIWRGTNPNATGGSLTSDGRTMLEVAPADFQARIAGASEVERMDIYREVASTFAREQPAAAIGLYLTKLRAFWWGSAATGQLYPASWVLVYELWYVPVLVLAVWGGWLGLRSRDIRSRSTALLLIVGVGLISATQAVFYVEGRHRLAVEPLLLVLAGVGAAELVALARPRLARWRQPANRARGWAP